MDERSPLLGRQVCREPPQSPDFLSPNLRPRHQELIPTPCGPIMSWSELSRLVKVYFCLSVASLLVLLGLTCYSIYKLHKRTDVSDEDNFTVSLVQLVGLLFCIYYICRGVLQENRLELVAFVLTMAVLVSRSVVIFIVQDPEDRRRLLVRFVCMVCLGLFHILCTLLLIRRPNMMAFRVGGALESHQEQYFLLNLCVSMLTFDLQAQLSLCILILTMGSSASVSNTIMGVGLGWACLTTAVGAITVCKESKVLVWIFGVLNLPQVAFFVYLMYTVIKKWFEDNTLTLEAVTVFTALISLLIKGVLFGGLIRLARLRERMFTPSS